MQQLMLAELQLEYCGSFSFYPDQYQHWLKLICFQHRGGECSIKNKLQESCNSAIYRGKVQKCQACDFKFLILYKIKCLKGL